VATTGASGTYGALPKYYPVTELVGETCPDFKAPRLADGVVQRFSSMLAKDKVNVLLFWSVDCPHCRQSLPEINKWLQANPDGVNLISAARVTDKVQRTRTQEFCKLNGITFTTLIDQDRAVAELFNITATPTALIVGPDGNVEDVYMSGAEEFGAMIEAKKKALLGKS
jgi:protein-disulfide isomerase